MGSALMIRNPEVGIFLESSKDLDLPANDRNDDTGLEVLNYISIHSPD